MRLSSKNFKRLDEWAKEFHGGYRRTFEVQLWDDKMDISSLTDDEMTQANVSHIPLNTNTELVNTGIVDIHVNGYLRHGDTVGEKLGCFDLKVQDGTPVAVRKSCDHHWIDWEHPWL